MKKLEIDEKFIINTKFITLFFPEWVKTKKNKQHEWLFYKVYQSLEGDSSFFNSNDFLQFKKAYIFMPYKYLQFEIYKTTNLIELKEYLLSDDIQNDFIDIYIARYDFKYCIKYAKAEHQNREVYLQTIDCDVS